MNAQTTSQLLMIRPVSFGFNAQTAVNNSFQKDPGGDIHEKALAEFDGFVDVLRNNKVDVTVIEDTLQPNTPDSIFPNNWISFHEEGKIFLYPMFAVNRRMERKLHVLDLLKQQFSISEIIDLSNYENEHIFLEGTGSMVLDRQNKIVYACLSPRTNEKLVAEYCGLSGFTAITFRSVNDTGTPIYHTNVMMCVASSYAVVCLASIPGIGERKDLIDSLQRTNKEIIDISLGQLNSFAGNMLQVKNADNEMLLVMSTQAFRSLNSMQLKVLEKYNSIIHSSLETIETAGGGSARCMMAEVFLDRK